MSRSLNSVKPFIAPESSEAGAGGLRAALVAAAMQIIEDAGPDAFSLREAARRAGVSAAAPAYHFRDTRGLLTSVATVGFKEFGDALEAAIHPDRRTTIVAQSHAYLRFATARPGLFRLMWRKSMLNMGNPEHLAAARRAFEISDRVVRGADRETVGWSEIALSPTLACWSMVHGFVGLVIDGVFFAHEAPERLDALLDSMLQHLDV